jgi:DNA-binding response OmpR family regulator
MGHRLLLIEDEDALREQLVELLQRHDFVIDACGGAIYCPKISL